MRFTFEQLPSSPAAVPALDITRHEMLELLPPGELIAIGTPSGIDFEPAAPLRRSPSIERAIDNTALDAYMTCPWKFLASMILHRRNQGAPPPPLAYGTAWHAGMEAHYLGGNRDAVQRAIIMAWVQHSKPDDHRTVQRCLLEYDNYVKRYGTLEEEQRSSGMTVGWPEQPLVEIPTEIIWPEALHPYAGKIDRIINLGGLYYVEDHKTTSALGAYYFKQFDPNNQMMGYAWLAQLLTGLPIAGVRINAHAVLKTQSKFERDIVSFDQDRLKEWGRNFNSWVVRLEDSLHRAKYWAENRGVDLFNLSGEALAEFLNAPSTQLSFPRNFNACTGKYGSCTYIDVCSMPPSVRHKVIEQKFAITPWDPMAEEDGGEA